MISKIALFLLKSAATTHVIPVLTSAQSAEVHADDGKAVQIAQFYFSSMKSTFTSFLFETKFLRVVYAATAQVEWFAHARFS